MQSVYLSNFANNNNINDYREIVTFYLHLANYALEKLQNSQHSQSIITSGESGSGKSESVKYLIHYLCHTATAADEIEQKINVISQILEVFGNAKTAVNDNSSRFGKFTEVS